LASICLPTTANVKNAIVEEVAVWTIGLNYKKMVGSSAAKSWKNVQIPC
jgi:hypothetical protein